LWAIANEIVLVIDQNGAILTELKCKRNHFFSNYYSGTSQIGNDKYSITCENDLNIGDVKIFVKDPFHRHASIQINEKKFDLRRKDLTQTFEVFDSSGQLVFTINGKLYKD
jgi:hypothetical protein